VSEFTAADMLAEFTTELEPNFSHYLCICGEHWNAGRWERFYTFKIPLTTTAAEQLRVCEKFWHQIARASYGRYIINGTTVPYLQITGLETPRGAPSTIRYILRKPY
jgi:hypothetical protein